MKPKQDIKVVLITGGTTGIGRATAVLFAKKGYEVYIFGRHQDVLEDALSDIKRLSGKEGHGFIADVTDQIQIEEIFNTIENDYDHLDILVNNAGIGARSVEDATPDEISYIIGVDLIGYMNCSRLALQMMLKRNSGHIINIGSMSAITLSANTDLYSSAKAGVAGFTDSFRKSVNNRCIKVTLIEPGSVGTEMIDEPTAKKIEMQKEEKLLKPEDIAEAILFATKMPKRCDIVRIQLKPHRQII